MTGHRSSIQWDCHFEPSSVFSNSLDVISVSNWACLKAGSLLYTYVILDSQTKSDDLVEFIIKLSEKRDLLSLIWAIVIYLISLFNSALWGFVKLNHSNNLWVISHKNDFIDPTRISLIFAFYEQILSKWLAYNRIQISGQTLFNIKLKSFSVL